jgi:hypothetical protein
MDKLIGAEPHVGASAPARKGPRKAETYRGARRNAARLAGALPWNRKRATARQMRSAAK